MTSAPTGVRIKSFVITSFPFTALGGGGWDLTSGTDMTFSIYINTGLYFESPIYTVDLAQSNLPLTVSTSYGLPLIFSNLSTEYDFGFWDYDYPYTNEWVGKCYFTPNDYVPTNGSGYPTTVNLVSVDIVILFDL